MADMVIQRGSDNEYNLIPFTSVDSVCNENISIGEMVHIDRNGGINKGALFTTNTTPTPTTSGICYTLFSTTSGNTGDVIKCMRKGEIYGYNLDNVPCGKKVVIDPNGDLAYQTGLKDSFLLSGIGFVLMKTDGTKYILINQIIPS